MLVASAAERAEYTELQDAERAPLMWVLGAPKTLYERRHELCVELQGKLWARIIPSLRNGELLARGFPTDSVEPVAIPAELWPRLACDFAAQEVRGTNGFELHLYQVTIAASGSAAKEYVPGSARRKVLGWLRDQAATGRVLVKKEDLLLEAKAAFPEETITLNLLTETLRDTGTAEALLFRGRPPKERC
jgi:hypothetical protein